MLKSLHSQCACKSLLSARVSAPLLLQRGTWSVTASAMNTLKSLLLQCAFVKPLISAHVSARCFYSRYVYSHHICGAQSPHLRCTCSSHCSCSAHVSHCTLHAVPTLTPSFLRWFLWSVDYTRVAFPSIHCGRSGCVGGNCIRRTSVQATVGAVRMWSVAFTALHSQSETTCSNHSLSEQ